MNLFLLKRSLKNICSLGNMWKFIHWLFEDVFASFTLCRQNHILDFKSSLRNHIQYCTSGRNNWTDLFHTGTRQQCEISQGQALVQEDKTPCSQALTNNTSCSITVWSLLSSLPTRVNRSRPQVRIWEQLIQRLTIRPIHHVLYVYCHDDAPGLFDGVCICLAAIRGSFCCPCELSCVAAQVSTNLSVPCL